MSAIHGWQTKRFDEFGELFSGSTPSTANANYWDGNIVWVTPADLSKLNSRYIHDSGKQITQRGLNACSTHLLPAGSIVLSSRAPIGYVALPTVPFCTNQGCKTIKLKKGFDSEFAYYNVLFNIKKIKDLGEGTTFAEISKTALASVEIDFPQSINEQAKIAEVLSTADRAIEQTEALIDKQQRIKTGLMQDLLTRGIDEHGNIRSEQTHKFKDSPLGRIPVEWDLTSLNACVRNDSPICYGILMPGPGHDNGVPVIKVRDIVGGEILRDNLLLTDPKIDKQYQRSRLREADLLITIRGTTGRIAVVPTELGGANITQDTARVRLNDDHSHRYFYFLLQSKAVQDQVSLHTIGQAVKGINIRDVKSIFLALPKNSEQQAIAERLEKIQETLNSTQGQLNKIRALRTGLMQDLLTGKKRVSALLEQEPKPEKIYARH
jgi:type I restriction enzyme S subunit